MVSPFISFHGSHRLGCRIFATHLDYQPVKYLSPTRFALRWRFTAVEERGLIGKDQARSLAIGKQLYRAQCAGNTRFAIMHRAHRNDPSLLHDVQIATIATIFRVTLRPEAASFAAADSEVVFKLCQFPIVAGYLP